ncbi:MAG: ATP synthase F0 subunit C [Desulfatiglandales bacterium]
MDEGFITLCRYLGAALSVGFGAIGAALGEGYAAGQASEAISYRPQASGKVLKNMLVGQAIAESAAIFALVVSILLIFGSTEFHTEIFGWAALSGGLCMGLAAIGSGIGAGVPAGTACAGIVRQPASSGKILTTMLLGSAVCQTPAIFGLVTAFLLIFLDHSNVPLYPGWAAMVGCGISTGLAAIGPGIGNGLTAGEAVSGVARNPEQSGITSRTMLVALGVAQSTAIYGFLISLMLLFITPKESTSFAQAMRLLSAGICMGFGAFGPGLGVGMTGAYTVKEVPRNPEGSQVLVRTMLVGMAVVESTGIYSLIIALLLIML